MARGGQPNRREVIRSATQLGVAGWLARGGRGWAAAERSQVFAVTGCPPHDGGRRHVGVDVLLGLLALRGISLYRTERQHPWGSASGLLAFDDIVVIKVNCQWKCRGATNTDVLRGLIQRVLEHPDGFAGEVVIVENGQGRGAFDGVVAGSSSFYAQWPEVARAVLVNAEDDTHLTVDYLVNTEFAGQPVSAYLLDPVRGRFLAEDEQQLDGYCRVAPPAELAGANVVSYPCFSTRGGHRVNLRLGRFTGSGWDGNVKLISVPVLKHHGGCGITGTLKHCYGLVSMADGAQGVRHYDDLGRQCGQFWAQVRPADLHLLDCIWVSHESLVGYPESTTTRCNVLAAGRDPVALDYWAAKHVLLPLGGSYAGEHDPDGWAVLRDDLDAARTVINGLGGIDGHPAQLGDANIEVVSRAAVPGPRRRLR
jgi:hypothetical protein